MLQKLTAFTKTVAGLPDVPSPAMSALQLKQWFDTAPEEMRVAFNALIDSLLSTTADSGAKNIGVQMIAGTSGNDVQAVLQDLKQQLNGAISGSIPDGSIGPEKLSFAIATNAASVSVADAGNHFTATNVEGVLDELFQSASSVKTNVANAIGAPATSSDTGATLAGHITTEKGRIAAEIGDGNNTSTLKYLADRLIVRSDAIATAVNGKGVAATSTDTLATLASKVGQINVSNIKTVQRGLINLSTGTSRTVAISSVDANKSIARIGYIPSAIQASNKDMFAVQLTNATTLTILNNAALAEAHNNVAWEVVEFSNVKSKQTGSVVFTGNPTTATVTAVDPAKALLFVSATTASNFNTANSYLFYGHITNGTTLTFYGDSNMTYYWQLIEFN